MRQLKTKRAPNAASAPRSISSYTIRNLDAAIAHLERVIAVDNSLAIFGASYWRKRIHEAQATPGAMHPQLLRLRALLERLDGAAVPAAAAPSASAAPVSRQMMRRAY